MTIDFKPAYNGAKGIYLHASTRGGYATEWQRRGTWEVPEAKTPRQPEEPPQP